jgi:signal transduction histidine kinase
MSHELRTPLNAIIGLTEMMVTNAARFGTEKAQEPLQRVNRAGTHLLIDKPRQVNRLGIEFELSRLNLGEVQHLVDEAEQVIGGKAEPRSAVAARGEGIGLGEFLEQFRLLFGGRANAGICDSKLDPVAAVRHLAHPQRNFALFCVARLARQQIEQNLFEPQGVSGQRTQVLLGFYNEAVLVLLGELARGLRCACRATWRCTDQISRRTVVRGLPPLNRSFPAVKAI